MFHVIIRCRPQLERALWSRGAVERSESLGSLRVLQSSPIDSPARQEELNAMLTRNQPAARN